MFTSSGKRYQPYKICDVSEAVAENNKSILSGVYKWLKDNDVSTSGSSSDVVKRYCAFRTDSLENTEFVENLVASHGLIVDDENAASSLVRMYIKNPIQPVNAQQHVFELNTDSIKKYARTINTNIRDFPILVKLIESFFPFTGVLKRNMPSVSDICHELGLFPDKSHNDGRLMLNRLMAFTQAHITRKFVLDLLSRLGIDLNGTHCRLPRIVLVGILEDVIMTGGKKR